jgi:type II secretory pathway component PulK
MIHHPHRHRPARRGLVTLVVIWAIAIASVIVAATQVLAFRQATLGREVLARTQARWAARAGVETMIAIMEWHTANPDTADPMALTRDLESNALGEVETGTWDIRHFIDGQEWAGPLDEHAKLNINNITQQVNANLRPILDWLINIDGRVTLLEKQIRALRIEGWPQDEKVLERAVFNEEYCRVDQDKQKVQLKVVPPPVLAAMAEPAAGLLRASMALSAA